MQMNEDILKVDLENFTPVEDLIRYYEDFNFEFPIRSGRIWKAFSIEGLTVLEDRQ